MHLDAFTVLVVGLAVVIMFGLQFVFFWVRDREAGWLGWLAVPFFVGALGVGLTSPRGVLPAFVTMGLGNAAIFIAFGSVWSALRIFERRKSRLEVSFIVSALWLLLCQWPPFVASMPWRVVVASLFVAFFAMMCAIELWRGREERLPSRVPAILVCLGFVAFMLARIPMAWTMPYPFGGMPMTGNALGIYGLITIVHAISLAMIMVSMTKERAELEQRGFALVDPLTGALNRRAFLDQSVRLMRRRRFGNEPIGLLVVDLDHFKSINDQYGHTVGDRVLIGFTDLVRKTIRPTDYFYRMGGEEFCCLLPEASLEQAHQIAERVRLATAGHVFEAQGHTLGITISVGVASSEHMGHDIDAMFASADSAVYAAKARGRNRTVVAGSMLGMRPLFREERGSAREGTLHPERVSGGDAAE